MDGGIFFFENLVGMVVEGGIFTWHEWRGGIGVVGRAGFARVGWVVVGVVGMKGWGVLGCFWVVFSRWGGRE